MKVVLLGLDLGKMLIIVVHYQALNLSINSHTSRRTSLIKFLNTEVATRDWFTDQSELSTSVM